MRERRGRPRRSARRSVDRRAVPRHVGAAQNALPLPPDRNARASRRRRMPGQLGDELRVEGVAALGPCRCDAQHTHLAPRAARSCGRSIESARAERCAAAAVTPLREDGAALDEERVRGLRTSSSRAGWTGFSRWAPRGGASAHPRGAKTRGAALSRCGRGTIQVAVHCGAQTTADTVLLAQDAAEAGADAVAVIGPPYYPFDEERPSPLRGGG